MDPIFTLIPLDTFINQITIDPLVWINNEQDLYKYTYLLTIHGMSLYDKLPVEIQNKIDDKFYNLKFRTNYINPYSQYANTYDFLLNYYNFNTTNFILNNFIIELITRFMLIHKYYNDYNNEDGDILENINEIKKILKEFNVEASQDKDLIDRIIKRIKDKKKRKDIDDLFPISEETIKRLLKKIMNKRNNSDGAGIDDSLSESSLLDSPEAKNIFKLIRKECCNYKKKYYKYKNKYMFIKNKK
jgi:hypothetical protein